MAFAISAPALAQPSGRQITITLQQALERLQANFVDYLRSVPSLFCDETVRSEYGPAQMTVKPVHSQTDSIFRLQRRLDPAHKLQLIESRDVKRVDGKPVTSGSIAGPAILIGAFGTGLGVAGTAQLKCISFKLHPTLTLFPPHRIVIDYATLPAPEADPQCSIRHSHGRVFVDPETMHIRRIEMTSPDYEIVPKVKGVWVWSVDYDPVILAGKPFWLPRAIDSDATSYGINQLTWTFRAKYTNYHKLEVRSRIVTDGVVEPTGEPPIP